MMKTRNSPNMVVVNRDMEVLLLCNSMNSLTPKWKIYYKKMGKYDSIFIRSVDLVEKGGDGGGVSSISNVTTLHKTSIKSLSVLRGRGRGATGYIGIDWFANINTGLLHNNAAQNEFMMILVTNLNPSFLSN